MANVSRRVNHSSRNEQFLTRLRVTYFAVHLELQLALQHADNLICRVRKTFPSPTGRIGPEVTTESTSLPVGGDLLAVNHPGPPFVASSRWT